MVLGLFVFIAFRFDELAQLYGLTFIGSHCFGIRSCSFKFQSFYYFSGSLVLEDQYYDMG